MQTSDRNGTTVAALQVTAGHEIMLISSTGTLVRTPVDEVSVLGRNTQGVRLIRLAEGERLVGIEHIESLDANGGVDVAGAQGTEIMDDGAGASVSGSPAAGGSEEPGPESSGPAES